MDEKTNKQTKTRILNVDGAVLVVPPAQVLEVFFEIWTIHGFVDSQDLLAFRTCMRNFLWSCMVWSCKGHQNVICYSDSLDAINLIQASFNDWHVYATIIRNINVLLDLYWNVFLTHILQKTNECANFFS